MLVAETTARAKELLSMQGCSSDIIQKVSAEEANRFLNANMLDSDRAARGLARRIKVRYEPIILSTIKSDQLKSMVPLFWSRDPTKSIMFMTIDASFNARRFLDSIGSSPKPFLHWFCEVVTQKYEATHSPLTVILDLSKASVAQLTTFDMDAFVQTGSTELQTNLPEILNQVYCLNASTNFSVLMYGLKRVCSSRTLDKFIKIASTGEIPPSVVAPAFIPKKLGGYQVDEFTDRDSVYSISASVSPHPDKSEPTLLSTVQKSSVADSGSPDARSEKEIAQLLEMLERTIQRAEECERVQLSETARLRSKLKRLEKASKSSMDEEEAALASQLKSILSERDSYRRAVLFARNYIESETREREEFQRDVMSKIEQKKTENLALVQALKDVFGQDAPHLLT